jgi:hypothetical protein
MRFSRGRGAYTRPVDYGKIGNIIYKYGNKAVVLTLLQTEDIGNNSMKAGTYGLKTCNM